MSDLPASANEPDTPTSPAAGWRPRRWTRTDTEWTLSLFGTAVGAGILFLPINAGLGGLLTLVIVTILIGPMTYLSHRALSRFVCASPDPDRDITDLARDFFGGAGGRFVTVLYFLAIFPIVPIYGVGLTNAVDSLITNQLGLASPPRWLLSGLLLGLLMLVMLSGQRVMLIVTQWVVYPLIAVLIGVTLYLVPSWSLEGFPPPAGPGEALMSIWLLIPVLVFAFNHSPAVSQFSLAMQRAYGDTAPAKASQVLRATSVLLVLFTMGFVWSCVLTLGADGLAEAKEANLPVLSYLANVHDSPVIGYLGPVVAITAIVSSFFGHYLGAAEGAAGMVRGFGGPWGARIPRRRLSAGIAVVLFLTAWIAAIVDPSILGLIESISGPVIASILYLMPMYAIHKVPALAPYRRKLSNVFVTIAGLVAVSGILLAFFR